MATKRVVDLVFLVDVSGSMRPCIDGLKESINQFFLYLTNEEENKLAIRDWRAKVVGYRDVAYDKDNWIVNNPFVTTAEEIRAQLQGLKATGGGDEPESLLDAILTVADVDETSPQEAPDPAKWRHRHDAARAVCVFSDATYHPTAQLEKYAGCTSEDVARKVAEKRVILELVTPVAPFDRSVPQEEFEKVYAQLAEADKAEYMPLTDLQGNPFPFEDIGKHVDVFHKFIEQLAKTISASVDPIIL